MSAAKENGGTGRRVFISYGHDEYAAFAVRLKNDLTAKGFDVWFDLERIRPGEDWEHYIEDGLGWVSKDPGGKIVLLMTPHSVRRPDGFCLNEIAMALVKNIKIIPVMLSWCEPPLSISRIQWLDMQDCIPPGDHEERYRIKLNRLAGALEKETLDIEGYQSSLLGTLKPLRYDAEINYRQDRFTGRAWVFDELDRWLSDDKASRVFWILGGPGVGKTSISSWLCAHRPEISAFHFCRYDNSQMRDPRRCVTSIAYQLSTQLPDYGERLRRIRLEDLNSLDARTLFYTLIVQPFSANYPRPDGNVVILIDALDEATEEGGNELAGFIASEFEKTPAWLRLIITSRPTQEVLAPLQVYKPFLLDISDPRNEKDIGEFLERELRRIGIGDPAPAARAIVEKSGGIFLYAEWIIHELASGRLSHDRLDDFPQGLGGIYLKFFERQFPAMGEWESWICPALEVVAAAQEPLGLRQLATVFGWSVHQERKFKKSLGSLFNFDRGIQPFHRSVIDWLSNETKDDPYFISVEEGHRTLVEYCWKEYRAARWQPYIISYLPLHLYMAKRWKDLEEALVDLEFIRAAREADRYGLLRLWALVEKNSGIRMAMTYGRIDMRKSLDRDRGLFAVADLLIETAHFDEAIRILDSLIGHYRENNDLRGLAECLNAQSWAYTIKGEYGKALELSREQEKTCRALNDNVGLAKSLFNQSHILNYTSDYNDALSIAIEAERICREIGDMYGLSKALNARAIVLLDRDHDHKATAALLKEQENINREYGYLDRLMSCLINEGECCRYGGNYEDAIGLYREAEGISYQLGDRWRRAIALVNQGISLQALGKLDEAQGVYEKAEKVSREIDDKSGISSSLNARGQVMRLKNKLMEAMLLHREAEKIARDIGYKLGLQECLGDQATIYLMVGEKDKALALLVEQEKLCREVGLKQELDACIDRQKAIVAEKLEVKALVK